VQEPPKETVLTEAQGNALLSEFLTDATKVRIYQLEEMVKRNIVGRQETLEARQRAFQQEQRKTIAQAEKSRRYRKQLRELNASHRLLKLEFKELKNKYDSTLRGIAEQKASGNPGHTASSGGCN